MKNRIPYDFIEDMICNSEKGMRFVSGFTKEKFLTDDLVTNAVARAIEIVGEAARHIPKELQAKFPEIPWSNIIGMRHRIAHDYIHLDLETLWDVATLNLAQLLPQLLAMKQTIGYIVPELPK